jgi:hypothetical protein
MKGSKCESAYNFRDEPKYPREKNRYSSFSDSLYGPSGNLNHYEIPHLIGLLRWSQWDALFEEPELEAINGLI